MKPASRSLLSGMGTVLLLVLVAAAGVVWQVRRIAHGQSLDRLHVAATAERELEANRLTELQLRGDLLAQDPAFVDYVAQSLIPNPQLGGAIDSASISDLLKDRRRGYDIAMVLDPQGRVVAASGILLKDHASIQRDALVTGTISQRQPQQGLWVDHAQLYWVSVSPLLRGGALQGVLIAASRVDDAFAIAISRMAHVDVALLMPPVPGAALPPSTGLGWTGPALSAQLADVLAVSDSNGQAVNLTDGQHATTAWVTPLKTSGERAALVAIGPDQDGVAVDPAALPWLIGVAGFGLCAMLLVLLQWWRTWLPLQRMLAVIELAGHGDQHLTIRTRGSAIVRRLRDGINPLLRRAR
ncbi:hypothetical protein ACVWWQ_000988 [Rhodanobacter sp. TND4EL1]